MASRKEQKAAARERLRREMEQRRRRARRNRIIGVTASVVVLVVAAVSIAVAVQYNKDKKAELALKNKKAVPTKINKDGLSIPYGKKNAPVVLTVYEDFRCPACQQFEDGAQGAPGYNPTIDKLVKAGKLRVDYHIATIIDANPQAPGNGSKNAGNAAVCANEVGKFDQFHDVLYKNQPDERQDLFTNKKVLELAKKVPGLADNDKFKECVEQNRYRTWLRKVQKEFDQKTGGAPSTPTLYLDGKLAFGGSQRDIAPEMKTPTVFEKTVEERAKKRDKSEGGPTSSAKKTSS